MVLLVMDPGPLRAGLEEALARSEKSFAATNPGHYGLFEKALGRRAILYAPSASLLEGKLSPAPDRKRVDAVLSASNAPGVRVLVAVLPEGDDYAEEIEAIRRFGTPYVILQAPPLLEEIGEAFGRDAQHELWLPVAGSTLASTAQVVADEAMGALETEWQGRIVRVSAESLGPVDLVQRVAKQTGVPVSARRIWGWLYRLIGVFRRWLGYRMPACKALVERLFPELGSGPRVRGRLPPAGSHYITTS